jgi:N-acetyl-alpha-D-muramate 1-phosphate uridylyltransferase
MLPVLILAGGLGTRLGELTESIPKVLVEVANKPFIYHQLKLLESNGIKEIVVALGHFGEKVQNYVEGLDDINMQINYSFDGDKLLGTGGAILNSLTLLSDPFYIMYGDSFLDIDYFEIAKYFLKKDKKALMTVLKNKNHWDRSNIEFSDEKILNYDKENITDRMEYVDYGLGILRKSAFENYSDGEKFDLAELYKKLINRNEMMAFEVKKRFYEVGSFIGINETSEYIKKKLGN